MNTRTGAETETEISEQESTRTIGEDLSEESDDDKEEEVTVKVGTKDDGLK